MLALVVDPAASSGYCVVKFDDKKTSAEIMEYGYIDVDTSSNYVGDWCLDLEARLNLIKNRYNIEEVAVEDFFFSSRFASGSNVNSAYRTVVHMWARKLGLPYHILNVSAWKTFVAGKSIPSKDQKLKWGKEAAKKLYIQQALWERYKFRFANHSLSEKTQKPIHFRFDIVDAIGQAVYYCRMIHGVQTVHMNVPVPPDVVFKKKNKKQFEYP